MYGYNNGGYGWTSGAGTYTGYGYQPGTTNYGYQNGVNGWR